MSQNHQNLSKLGHLLAKLTTFYEPRPYRHFAEMIALKLKDRHLEISALFTDSETLILY